MGPTSCHLLFGFTLFRFLVPEAMLSTTAWTGRYTQRDARTEEKKDENGKGNKNDDTLFREATISAMQGFVFVTAATTRLPVRFALHM